MKHAIINTILATMGIAIAATTAWFQFAPASDQLQLASEGLVNIDQTIKVTPSPGLSLISPTSNAVLGPVIWKLRVYNASDRTVSVVGYEVFLLTNEDHRAYYSEMREQLVTFDALLNNQLLPDNIAPRSSKAYIVSMHIPFELDENSTTDCVGKKSKLTDIQRCFFKKGRDLFGNPVETLYSSSDAKEEALTGWQVDFNGPRFLVIMETADGSKFKTVLSYFPFMAALK